MAQTPPRSRGWSVQAGRSMIAKVGHAEDDTHLGFSGSQRPGWLKGRFKDTVVCTVYLVV